MFKWLWFSLFNISMNWIEYIEDIKNVLLDPFSYLSYWSCLKIDKLLGSHLFTIVHWLNVLKISFPEEKNFWNFFVVSSIHHEKNKNFLVQQIIQIKVYNIYENRYGFDDEQNDFDEHI